LYDYCIKMIPKIINNLPNIDKRTKEPMQNLKQSNFYNLETIRKEKNTETFDDYMSSLYQKTLHSSDVPMTKKGKTDVEITAEENDDGEKKLSILSAIASDDKPVPKKIPNVTGVDNTDAKIEEVDTKKYKLDWLSTAYVGTISVIGLFIAYKAIKKTI